MSTKAMRMCCWQSRSKIRSEQTAAGVRAVTEVDGGQSKDKVNVMFLDGPNLMRLAWHSNEGSIVG